ncbi:uncharacterized protein L969DRAFT_335629 [Mixia osmundae IAM 14324]|uniref:uncharacterized protein n=1 Tax=Mixia osmundae (strain CBS 9802 / IAM 14324 / JCM 22182 / KY 12970) TaxID=764103 RepID=UPI0004A55913|nr:uncharacterized protein L969DRAFT_335629 [Mixia osmundae IAM 14324]KEI40499.1 hypothetical protein L969DRAFT_335629 [Mixia osmundae IAM 14324]
MLSLLCVLLVLCGVRAAETESYTYNLQGAAECRYFSGQKWHMFRLQTPCVKAETAIWLKERYVTTRLWHPKTLDQKTRVIGYSALPHTSFVAFTITLTIQPDETRVLERHCCTFAWQAEIDAFLSRRALDSVRQGPISHCSQDLGPICAGLQDGVICDVETAELIWPPLPEPASASETEL